MTTEQSPEEVRLLVIDHFVKFFDEFNHSDDPEERAADQEGIIDFATMWCEAMTLEVVGMKDGVITATMKLKPIEDLLAQTEELSNSE